MRNISFSLAMIAILALPTAVRAQDSLNGELEPIRTQYGLPALGAAVVKDGKIIASGVVGVRVYGMDIPVTLGDRFHIGSDTKAMTATLAGMMIEQGKLRWDSTIGEVLGPVLPGLMPKFAAIKLEQLLSHTSGIPTDNDEIMKLYFSPDAYDYTLTDYRLRMISAWGTKHEPMVSEHPAVSLLEPRLHHRRRDDRASIGRVVGEADHDAHFRAAGAQVRRPRTAGDVRKIRCSRRSRRRRQGQHLAEAVGSLR